MLNSSLGGGSSHGNVDSGGSAELDGATHDLCIRLMAEHIAMAVSAPSEGAWAEVERTIAFIETHTVEPVAMKRAIFGHALELLRGTMPLPSKQKQRGGRDTGAGMEGGSAAASGLSLDNCSIALPVWSMVLRLALLVEE